MKLDVAAIAFDLDDTLCAYWDASKAALREAFTRHPAAGYTPDEMIGHWAMAFRQLSPKVKSSELYPIYLKNGEPTRTMQMAMTLARVGVEDDTHAKNLSTTYADLRDQGLRLFPDALDVLTKLKERYPLALITNGPADIQRQEIETLQIAHFFDHFFIEGEMLVGKPEKEVFARAEEAFGVPPEKLLMVGNSYGHDILGAIKCGWKTAWIRRESDVPPSQNRAEERPEGSPEPTLVIHELSELLYSLA